MKVGYIRVSSKKQNYDRQYAVLHDKVERIFCEKKSGKTTEGRTELEAMIDFVREGDSVYVSSIDRLGRDLMDILSVSKELEGKKVNIVSVKEGIDTNTSLGRMYMVIAGILAEVELSLINERAEEGREAAKAEGRTGGRPRIEISEEEKKIIEEYIRREKIGSQCREKLNMSKSTFYRRVKEYKDSINKEKAEKIVDNEVVEFGKEEKVDVENKI